MRPQGKAKNAKAKKAPLVVVDEKTGEKKEKERGEGWSDSICYKCDKVTPPRTPHIYNLHLSVHSLCTFCTLVCSPPVFVRSSYAGSWCASCFPVPNVNSQLAHVAHHLLTAGTSC